MRTQFVVASGVLPFHSNTSNNSSPVARCLIPDDQKDSLMAVLESENAHRTYCAQHIYKPLFQEESLTSDLIKLLMAANFSRRRLGYPAELPSKIIQFYRECAGKAPNDVQLTIDEFLRELNFKNHRIRIALWVLYIVAYQLQAELVEVQFNKILNYLEVAKDSDRYEGVRSIIEDLREEAIIKDYHQSIRNVPLLKVMREAFFNYKRIELEFSEESIFFVLLDHKIFKENTDDKNYFLLLLNQVIERIHNQEPLHEIFVEYWNPSYRGKQMESFEEKDWVSILAFSLLAKHKMGTATFSVIELDRVLRLARLINFHDDSLQSLIEQCCSELMTCGAGLTPRTFRGCRVLPDGDLSGFCIDPSASSIEPNDSIQPNDSSQLSALSPVGGKVDAATSPLMLEGSFFRKGRGFQTPEKRTEKRIPMSC